MAVKDRKTIVGELDELVDEMAGEDVDLSGKTVAEAIREIRRFVGIASGGTGGSGGSGSADLGGYAAQMPDGTLASEGDAAALWLMRAAQGCGLDVEGMADFYTAGARIGQDPTTVDTMAYDASSQAGDVLGIVNDGGSGSALVATFAWDGGRVSAATVPRPVPIPQSQSEYGYSGQQSAYLPGSVRLRRRALLVPGESFADEASARARVESLRGKLDGALVVSAAEWTDPASDPATPRTVALACAASGALEAASFTADGEETGGYYDLGEVEGTEGEGWRLLAGPCAVWDENADPSADEPACWGIDLVLVDAGGELLASVGQDVQSWSTGPETVTVVNPWMGAWGILGAE